MKVFLSWSGEPSGSVARALKSWLPRVFPDVQTFMSAEDASKGRRWVQSLWDELQTSTSSIVCLTPNNLLSPWILFEAGALARDSASTVNPLLFGITEDDVPELPLRHFQMTVCERDDLLRLVRDLNASRPEPLDPASVERSFNENWRLLNASLGRIRKKYRPTPASPRFTRYPQPLSERHRMLIVRDELHDMVLPRLVQLLAAAQDGHLVAEPYRSRLDPESLNFANEQFINGMVHAGAAVWRAMEVVYELLAETDGARDRLATTYEQWQEIVERVERDMPWVDPDADK